MAVIRVVSTAKGKKYQVMVRKGGHVLSRTFWRKDKAEDWERGVEDAISNARPERPFDHSKWLLTTVAPAIPAIDETKPHTGWTIKTALQEYGEKVTPSKKGAIQELSRIGQWQYRELSKKRLDELTTGDLEQLKNDRIAAGKSGSTVMKDLLLISALYKHAIKKWSLPLVNPVTDVGKPEIAEPRKRRFEDAHDGSEGEEELIRAALRTKPRGPEMLDLLDLAIEMGMRQTELLTITAGQFRKAGGVSFIYLPKTKNNESREVTLSKKALEIITRWSKDKDATTRLFTQKPADLRQRWRAACKTAGVTNMRWHDLRHVALTRMHVEKGMDVSMLKQMSGHKTMKILFDYVNPSHKDVAKKLG